MPDKINVIVCVEGGCVTCALADNPNVAVRIVDWDEIEIDDNVRREYIDNGLITGNESDLNPRYQYDVLE
jgi:hypothetical protein